MSGIEVAGLVLGALPLIIQAITSYKEGLDPVKGFWKWDKELPKLIRKLGAQHDQFNQTIQILFGSITTDAEWLKMTADPRASLELWKSKETALQEKLQNTYKSYQNTMAEIERIMTKIANKLDLDKAAELTRNDLEAILAAHPKKADDTFEFGKRVKFAMNKKSVKGLLDELDECNRQLERFTEKSEKIETFHKATKPSYATRLQKLQRYAKILHESLNLCWSCACKSSHTASLQLEPRESVFASKHHKMYNSAKTSFNVSFSTISSDSHGAPWLFQAAEFHVDDEEEEGCLTPMPSPKPRVTKSVSFGSLPPYAVLDPGTSSLPSYEEVSDLCASIQQLHKTSSTIGFSLNSKSKLRGAYSVDSADAYMPSTELISLETLLERPPMINGKKSKLSKKERYSLALTLASSILYLNSTPWLASKWTARDIFFHRTSDPTRPIDITRPYLAPSLFDIPKDGEKKPKPVTFENNILLALAVALLELYFGTTAEKYRKSEIEDEVANAQVPEQWKMLTLVHTWSRNEAEEMSAAFQSAIGYCSSPMASLQNADCLQSAVENIVLPLQEELNQFLGKTLG
ncbi:uncharacterized protein J4E78_009753 [Alternaria triticimaculans]|uniref:uncharacterized protein n=1 Tax=Alternaria triticimaculans TaxID=297637 RepID=UPI0020C24A81|nr:uncharacterized protein J4E78_009753 [Alternaria triticimaculans]KAI4643972.1 hypothetical protein J4E78_009753 [Alternaria triticimaculans]